LVLLLGDQLNVTVGESMNGQILQPQRLKTSTRK